MTIRELYRLIDRGGLPGFWHGGSVVVVVVDVDAFSSAHPGGDGRVVADRVARHPPGCASRAVLLRGPARRRSGCRPDRLLSDPGTSFDSRMAGRRQPPLDISQVDGPLDRVRPARHGSAGGWLPPCAGLAAGSGWPDAPPLRVGLSSNPGLSGPFGVGAGPAMAAAGRRRLRLVADDEEWGVGGPRGGVSKRIAMRINMRM